MSGIVDDNGWPKCIPEIFTSNEFAPSVSSSTQLNLPEEYPLASEPNEESSDESDGDSDTCIQVEPELELPERVVRRSNRHSNSMSDDSENDGENELDTRTREGKDKMSFSGAMKNQKLLSLRDITQMRTTFTTMRAMSDSSESLVVNVYRSDR